jgi:hypothetical protein
VKNRAISIMIAVGLALTVCCVRSSRADPEECQNAISEYNAAVSDISTVLRRYTRCISGSQGRDDCSTEFRRLRSVQNDFENAVSRYTSECN